MPGPLGPIGMVAARRIYGDHRKETNGKKSMDDVIRLEYQPYSGARGYTSAEFNKTASDAAGFNVEPLLTN